MSVVDTAGIYIHIPFCERKCVYCNFNTTDFNSRLARRYVSAVAAEIGKWGGLLAGKSGGEAVSNKLPVDSIFFGGGTPSTLTSDQMAALLEACRDSFELASDAEVTIEMNPSKADLGRMRAWRQAGINRASVGVQSFIDRELEGLSRTHNADDARSAFYALREAGFDNISLDLIAGLPEQTRSDWEFNLIEALALKPEHLSLYLLEIKEGTQLHAQIERGLRVRPDDDLAGEMYGMICAATTEAGYEHYEISNFALAPQARQPPAGPSAYRSRHNMKYWTGAPFYGVGCGAHSYDGISRWVNIKQTERYIESVSETGQAIAEHIDLSSEDRASEALFMGLRLLDGVDLVAFHNRYGVDVNDRYGAELERLGEAGLVEMAGTRLRLTSRGLVLSNEVFVAFV
jgi:oxygen-independent coproporphyrinogen-3 oxidase